MPSLRPDSATTRLTFRSDPRELRSLRQQLKVLFTSNDIRPDLAEDLILVANELTTNAIEAAEPGSAVTVQVDLDPKLITLAVENVGTPFTLPSEVALPDKTRSRGRGLALTSRIVDELCAEPFADGTRMVARCRRS